MEPDGDMLGEVIDGKLKINKRLGGGTYGTTYRAYDLQLRRDVALKRIPHDEGAIREARSLAQINHPHVVKVIDVVENYEDHDYIVMEFVDGPTLRDLLDRGEVEPRVWWDVLRRLLSALQEVHRHMVHSDIKPENIVLRDDQYSQPVLIDFGLASTPGLADWEVGTWAYRPPEAEAGAMSAPGDLFSLAVMSHEALFGVVPEEGPEYRQNMRTDLQMVGGKFYDALARALNEDGLARPQSAFEFAAEMVNADRPHRESDSSFMETLIRGGSDAPEEDELASYTRTGQAPYEPTWTSDGTDSLASVKRTIASQSNLHVESVGLLAPEVASAATGANQVGRLRSDWEDYAWYDGLDYPERSSDEGELRQLERLNDMPAGSLVLKGEFEEHDLDVGATSAHTDYKATLASWRRSLEENCGLPRNSLSLLRPQEHEGRRQVGTFLRQWEEYGWTARVPTATPTALDGSLTVEDAIQRIENSNGLPHGSVFLRKPEWDAYSRNTRISIIRRDYGIPE